MKITKKDIFLSYLSQFLKIASGVLVIPMILIWVPSNELGIWYLFTTISAFILLLDFGFSPTIMRNVAYVFSGVTELKSTGYMPSSGSEVDYDLLKSMIRGIKQIYLLVALTALLLLLSFGTIYVKSIVIKLEDYHKYMYLWIAYACVVVVNLYFLFYNPLLLGRGLIGKSYIITIITNICYILIVGIGVYMKFGLVAIIAGNAFTIILTIILSYNFFFDKGLTDKLRNSVPRFDSDKEILKILWPNAYKVGLVAIGAYCISKSSMFFVTSFTDLKTLASYGLSLSALTFIAAFSQIFFNAFLPEFNQLRVIQDTPTLIRKFGMAHAITLVTFISGILVLVLFGNRVLSMIHVSTFLLSSKYLLPIGIIYLLEVNYTNFSAIIITKNEIPYVKQSLISGFFIVVISYILFKYTFLGVWSIIISQGLVQLSYNYWRWPYVVCKEFRISYFRLLHAGLNEAYLKVRSSLLNLRRGAL
jgi:O-antigen/teichoic acid export membrane protein